MFLHNTEETCNNTIIIQTLSHKTRPVPLYLACRRRVQWQTLGLWFSLSANLSLCSSLCTVPVSRLICSSAHSNSGLALTYYSPPVRFTSVLVSLRDTSEALLCTTHCLRLNWSHNWHAPAFSWQLLQTSTAHSFFQVLCHSDTVDLPYGFTEYTFTRLVPKTDFYR